MQKTSDQFYDEVEARWIAERKHRAAKLRSRAWQMLVPTVLLILVSIGSILTKNFWAIATVPPFFGLLFNENLRRWKLEDRVEALEKKAV